MNAVLALVGPTASGKSRMAVEVARDLPRIEIVSCDSMAVYRGLEITAAIPAEAERGGVPHHLIGIADPCEDFTAVRFRDAARAAIASVHAVGAVPLLVGGSGLYFRAVVDELEFAPTDPDVRARLEREDPQTLWDRVVAIDPAAAERIDPRNRRRIVRAAEILELTGRPPSELRRSWDRFESRYDLTVVGLTRARDELLRRADERMTAQLQAGLVDEVRRAMAGGLSRTATQALGVKEIVEHLEGRRTLEEATDRFRRNVRTFVRRQLQWFRADPRVAWMDVSDLGWERARDAIVTRFSAALR